MNRIAAYAALVSLALVSGCIFVDEADQAWQTGTVDEALVGSWSSTNHFRGLRFSLRDNHLALSLQATETDDVGMPTNLQVRTTRVLGCDALMFKNIWESTRSFMSAGSSATTNPVPRHLAHGYLVVPYRVRGNTLTFFLADQRKIEATVQAGQIAGFLRKPPPARDLTPPILAHLDTNTVSVLRAFREEGTLLTGEQTYIRSEQAESTVPVKAAPSASSTVR